MLHQNTNTKLLFYFLYTKALIVANYWRCHRFNCHRILPVASINQIIIFLPVASIPLLLCFSKDKQFAEFTSQEDK
jgi:hypothetical protein